MSNQSAEMQEMLLVVSDEKITAREKLVWLLSLQEKDPIKYDIKQTYSTKGLSRTSIGIAAFLKDIELFKLLNNNNLLNIKDVLCSKKSSSSMSVIIPLIYADNSPVKGEERTNIVKEWVLNDKVSITDKTFMEGYIPQRSSVYLFKERPLPQGYDLLKILLMNKEYKLILDLLNLEKFTHQMIKNIKDRGFSQSGLSGLSEKYSQFLYDNDGNGKNFPLYIELEVAKKLDLLEVPILFDNLHPELRKFFIEDKGINKKRIYEKQFDHVLRHSSSDNVYKYYINKLEYTDTDILVRFIEQTINNYNERLNNGNTQNYSRYEYENKRNSLSKLYNEVISYNAKKEKAYLENILNNDELNCNIDTHKKRL